MSASSILMGHLKYCRQRAAVIGLLGLATLLAWRALPGPELQSVGAQKAYVAEQRLLAQRGRLVAAGGQLAKWLPTVSHSDFSRSQFWVGNKGSALERLGIPAHNAVFFTASNRIEAAYNAVWHLSDHPLPAEPGEWSADQLGAVAALIGGWDHKRWATEVADLARVRGEFERALANPEGEALAREGLKALADYDQRLARLDQTAPKPDPRLAKDLKSLASDMEALGISKLGALELTGRAQAATKALAEGSLSVLGFSVPGLVVRLLVPIIALGVALDLMVATLRARDFARRALPDDQAGVILAGFPWGPTQADDGSRPRRLGGGSFAVAPTLLALCAMAPLILAGDRATAAIGIAVLIAAGGAVLASTRVLNGPIPAAAKPYAPDEAADLRLDLAKEQLDATSAAFGLLALTCVAVLSFFLAFLLVPPSLLSKSERIGSLVATRNSFDQAYTQRLLEQSKLFVDWCDGGGCGVWTDFGFGENALGAEHPAKSVIAKLAHHPIVLAEMSGTSATRDLVTESRARLADLDPHDLGEVREILYRDSFDPIVLLLGDLQRLNVSVPLPPEVLDRLPKGVADRPLEGMSVPFSMPYKTMVERGGFADRLAPLPKAEHVQRWLEFLDENGLARVAGFDLLAGALSDFETEIGKAKLKFAGVDVKRDVAGDAALLVLCLMTISLAARLRGARIYLEPLGPEEGGFALSSAPGLLFWRIPPNRRWLDIPVVLACLSPAAIALMVLRVADRSALPPIVAVSLVVTTAAATIIIAIERARLVRQAS